MAAWDQLMRRWDAAHQAYVSAFERLNSIQSRGDREAWEARAQEARSKLLEVKSEVAGFVARSARDRGKMGASLVIAEVDLAAEQSANVPEVQFQKAARVEGK